MNQVKEAFEYAKAVTDGSIIACNSVRLTCQRFLADVNDDTKKFYFDRPKAQHVLDFFTHVVKFVKGDEAGQPFKLQPWQILFLVNIYGFRMNRNPEERRFKNAILFVARKNGKSALSAALPIYEMLYGGEGQELYSVATMREQAKIVWDSTTRMIQKAPTAVKDRFKLTKFGIFYEQNFNSYKTLGRDSKSLDGLRPVLCVFDEFAQVTDRNIWEVIQSGQGSITNYLNLMITTAADTKETTCYENIQYVEKVLSGDIADESWYAQMYQLDEGDIESWDDKEVWLKANPNLGVSISYEYLANQVLQAQEIPSKRNNIKIKHMNIWASTSDAWLVEENWTDNTIDEIDRTGHLYVGMDLGSTSDFTALAFLFKNGDKYHVEFKCFLPEDSLEGLPKYTKDVYAKAIDSGSLLLTPGAACDYSIVKQYIQEYVKGKDLKEICADPWNSARLVSELIDEGAPVVEVSQGMRPLSPASKATEVGILRNEILHEDDPFITWQFNNTTCYTDPNDNIKLRKGSDSNLKIDAIVALVIGMARAESNGGLNKQSFNISFL